MAISIGQNSGANNNWQAVSAKRATQTANTNSTDNANSVKPQGTPPNGGVQDGKRPNGPPPIEGPQGGKPPVATSNGRESQPLTTAQKDTFNIQNTEMVRNYKMMSANRIKPVANENQNTQTNQTATAQLNKNQETQKNSIDEQKNNQSNLNNLNR